MSRIRDLGRKSTNNSIEDAVKNYKKMHKEKSPEEKYYLLPLHTELNVKCTELKVLYLIEKPYTCSCCISYTCGLDNCQFNLIGFLLSLRFTSAK